MARFSGACNQWLQMFARSQSFTQWLEVRLAPADEPDLEVVFFNEARNTHSITSSASRMS